MVTRWPCGPARDSSTWSASSSTPPAWSGPSPFADCWSPKVFAVTVVPVTKIEAVAGNELAVHRLIEDGYQRLKVQLPALLGVSSEINEARHPSVRGTMAAGRAMIAGWKASDIGLAPQTPKVELRELQIQLRTTKAELIEGASGAEQGAKLADKLHELGLI